MAEEVFALSPISARAAQPSEGDYDAIREAFMETSRGRWFLGEYAKRNRNADTGMVLDAVARIEEALAAQRQQQQASDDNGLEEALAAVRAAVDRAAEAASAVIESMGLEENLAPIRKGTRIIREISWRWREIGADGRICDLIDSQIDAIEAGCGRIAEIDPSGALNGAFDLIKTKIDGLMDGEAPAMVEGEPAKAEEAVAAVPAAAAEPAAILETETPAATDSATAANDEADEPPEMAMPPAEPVEMTAEAVADAEAHDEAILDAIAIEMAAPDPEEPPLHLAGEPAETAEVTPPPSIEPVPEMQAPGPPPASAALLQRPFQPEPQAPLTPALDTPPSPQLLPEPSLGSTILATGIVQRPKPSAGDPLAPIRRMSQAEKIAFFS